MLCSFDDPATIPDLNSVDAFLSSVHRIQHLSASCSILMARCKKDVAAEMAI